MPGRAPGLRTGLGCQHQALRRGLGTEALRAEAAALLHVPQHTQILQVPLPVVGIPLRLLRVAPQHLLPLPLQHEQLTPFATQPRLEPGLFAFGGALQWPDLLAQTGLQVVTHACALAGVLDDAPAAAVSHAAPAAARAGRPVLQHLPYRHARGGAPGRSPHGQHLAIVTAATAQQQGQARRQQPHSLPAHGPSCACDFWLSL